MNKLIYKNSNFFRKHSKVKSNLPTTFFLTDFKKIPNIFDVVRSLKPNTLIIIRDYEIDDRQCYAKQIIKIARIRNNKVLIAGDLDMAINLNADGIHLPQYLISSCIRIKKFRPNFILTVAVHDNLAVKLTNRLPIDSILVSPVFETTSHPDKKPKGVSFLKSIQNISNKPVYALGGVNLHNINNLYGSKISGIAGIDIFK